MRAGHVLTVIVTLLVLSSLFGCAAGKTQSGTETIEWGDFVRVDADFYEGEFFTVSYSFEVKQGPPIDVYVLTKDQYFKYINGEEFQYTSSVTNLGSTGGEGAQMYPVWGTYYFVLDNTDFATSPEENGTAVVEWELEASSGDPGEAAEGILDLVWVGTAVAIVAIVAVVLVAVLVLRRRGGGPQAPQQRT